MILKNPKDLISSNRLDIGFKIYYLLNKDDSNEVYSSHLGPITSFKYIEFDDPKKNSLEKFVQTFNEVNKSIKCNGFDYSKSSLIPLSKDGSILNGSHRIASLIYNKCDKIECVVMENQKPLNYNYVFFRRLGVKNSYIEKAVLTLLNYTNKCFVAVIWPTASDNLDFIEKKLKEIIYVKRVSFNFLGLCNFVSQIYPDEQWLGNVENNFKGSKVKAINCYKKNRDTIIIFFNSKKSDHTFLKNNIRDNFKIGKHSIHICDHANESLNIAKIVLNNGVEVVYNNFDLLSDKNLFVSSSKKYLIKLPSSLGYIPLNKSELTFDYSVMFNDNLFFGYNSSDKLKINFKSLFLSQSNILTLKLKVLLNQSIIYKFIKKNIYGFWR